MGNKDECPRLCVLMPVYNGGRYLRESIASILAQSFKDFELLIIDDGSTDDSVSIVKSFSDPRIRLVLNEHNIGVARTLNKGLELARGEFIARMDADDISLPKRFEKQLAAFNSCPEVVVVATKVQLIDSNSEDSGEWLEDVTTSTHEEIVRCLPRANCIAHPSVMIKTAVARQYMYWDRNDPSQDYNLWLRLTANHLRIEKIDDILLKYRVHSQSITSESNHSFYGYKDIVVKSQHILYRMMCQKSLNRFDFRVAWFLFLDTTRLVLNKAEELARKWFRKCLIVIGRVGSTIVSQESLPQIFFFFPFFHVGGAERVHADTVAAVAEQRPWVIITCQSSVTNIKEVFLENGRLIEIAFWLNNAIGRIICLGYFSSLINRSGGAIVFGSNTPFYYELLPYLSPGIQAIDLLHAFGGDLEHVSLPYVPRLNRRVIINEKTRADLRSQYVVHGYSPDLCERILVIENAVQVPEEFQEKIRGNVLRVLYVGRGSEEKRVHLVAQIAKLCLDQNLPVSFKLVGDVAVAVPEDCLEYCTLIGEVDDVEKLEQIYSESDLLLVTSSTEGFPMVIMEAMARGVVPISTDVGGISVHVIDGHNGYLVSNSRDERAIVVDFVKIIRLISKDPKALDQMAECAYLRAAEYFGFERFNHLYRELLIPRDIQRNE